jgi:hypothetical protein
LVFTVIDRLRRTGAKTYSRAATNVTQLSPGNAGDT